MRRRPRTRGRDRDDDGQTTLRYDSTSGQFIQNWQTPTIAGACFKVTMTTQDISTLVAYFKFK